MVQGDMMKKKREDMPSSLFFEWAIYLKSVVGSTPEASRYTR